MSNESQKKEKKKPNSDLSVSVLSWGAHKVHSCAQNKNKKDGGRQWSCDCYDTLAPQRLKGVSFCVRGFLSEGGAPYFGLPVRRHLK